MILKIFELILYDTITYWMDIRILIIVTIDCERGNYDEAIILSAAIKEYIYPNSKQWIGATQVASAWKTKFWHRCM